MGPPIDPETFRALADAAPILLWASGPDGGCTYFNQAWVDFTGRPLAAQLGDGWVESVHPEDREGCLEGYRAAFAARRPFTLEYRLRRHDGAYRWMLDTGAPREDGEGAFAGYVGVCIDVTERREAEETTRRSERRFRDFVETTGQVWWFISTDYSR
ncbi:MAG: PAS domain-containing protein, partial [Candidatus Methylomirabilis sp.]|nr:PAS domain-containing protein [Deltaproteobacteria bacterium]